MENAKTLYIIVPCYNEEECLPETAPVFVRKLKELEEAGLAGPGSRVLFVDDGSKDATWTLIRQYHEEFVPYCAGLRLIPNGGHQKAVMAGIQEALEKADVSISIDVDLQDDIGAMNEMMTKYLAGAELVCGVRAARTTDTFLKRFTAEAYYKLMNLFGAKLIYNHADYRLMSREAMRRLCLYHDENLFLRGMITRLGLPAETVSYDRTERVAGESKYTLKKMLKLAKDGFTCGKMKPKAEPRPLDKRIAEILE